VEYRSAFNRAWDTLAGHRVHVWTARIVGSIAALLTAALLGILALFVDLLIAKGNIPAEHELAPEQFAAFMSGLEQFDGERRTDALEAVGVPAERVAAYGVPYEKLVALDRERLWRAYVWNLLDTRVSAEAAAIYADRAKTTDPRYDISGMGLLSLVVRTHGLRINPAIGWLARWNAWAWRPDVHRTPNFWYLTGLLILAVIVALLRAVLTNTMNYAAAAAGITVAVRLRRSIYHHAYRLGTLTIRSTGPGEAAGLFARDVDRVQDGIQARLTSQFFCPLELGFIVLFALAIHFWLALAFVLAALLVLLWGGQIAENLRRASHTADRRASARMTLLQESLMIMRLVKSNVMELFNQSRVERQLSDYADARLKRARGEAFFRPLLWFLGTLAGAVLLYVAGLIVLSAGLGTANVIVLCAAIVAAYWPLRDWVRSRRRIQRGQESAVLIYEFLDRPREVGQVVGAEFLPAINKGVDFRSISLRDPASGRVLLQDVTLRIAAGERVGLVGTDPAETHAVVHLLSRFLDPSGGEIRIDDKNLKWLTFDSIRAQIGVILQPSLIFNDTVAANIGCGDSGYSVPQIIEAAKVAHAHQFVQRLPYGYETPIGEMGSSLRPGEQFRIALARAILRDPAMYVIEEPATPLDDETKDLLDDTFSRILPGKTVLFLPHRISTIRSCERLYLIHQGRVEAVGEHRELIAGNDLYKHLHYLEFNEFAAHI
jgi:ABC-type multidrug transport system fused ATPase/permease subunit